MTKSRNMTKRQNRGDGCNRLRFMSCENGGTAPWSDLDHDVLFLVMMKLEAIDFLPFSGVCKSWRSLALPNKTRFMASRPPLAISISKRSNKKEYWLEDFEGRKSKMPLPQSGSKTCVGLTCGYLVLFGKRTRDFWLVNPITRHGLYFPKIPCYDGRHGVRAILVFSPSVSAWVFVVLSRYTRDLLFSIEGKGAWNYVYSWFRIYDLHDFNGKIYAIDADSYLFELGLDPEPKLTPLKTKNYVESEHRIMSPDFLEFVCSGENLYAMECFSKDDYEVHKLDFGEMKWVLLKKGTIEEDAFFVSNVKHGAAVKRELLLDSWLRYKKYTSRNGMFFTTDIWYYTHDCLKVDLKH